jgi:hypothetical protein
VNVRHLTVVAAAQSGLADTNDCQPSCAQGTQSKTPVTIALTGLQPWNNGQAYATMTVTGMPAPYTSAFSSFTGLAP